MKMTQEDLAGKLSVSPQAISKWERDECFPDAALLPMLADELGVSLDRLFGRQRTDLLDIAYHLSNLINGLNEKEKFRLIRQVAILCEYGMVSPDLLQKEEQCGLNDWNLDTLNHSVCNETESGFTFDSNRSELPFFSIFPEPESGWGQILKPDEGYRECFSVLSDEKALNTLFALFQESNGFSFDNTYAMREFSLDHPAETLNKLVRLGILGWEIINIDGVETEIWSFRSNCGWIAFFAILNETLYHHRFFDLQSNSRTSPYLSKNKCRK